MAKQSICIKCGKRKPLDQYRPGRNICLACIRHYGSAWNLANKVRINAKRRARYLVDREAILARVRKRRNSPHPRGPYPQRMFAGRR